MNVCEIMKERSVFVLSACKSFLYRRVVEVNSLRYNLKWVLPTTHVGSAKRGSPRLALATRRTALTRGVSSSNRLNNLFFICVNRD